MDVDHLISAVFERPCIWDKRSKDHANRNVVDKAWKEISNALNIEDAALRKKWKNLRGYFGVEYSKKKPMPRSGDVAEDYTSKYQYYKQLLFLKHIVAPRRCTSSLESIVNDGMDAGSQADNFQIRHTVPEPERDNASEVLDVSGDSEPTTSVEPSPELQRPVHINPQQDRGKRRKSSVLDNNYDKLIELEKKTLKFLNERSRDDDDDDLYFLKSLLPYIKRIPAERKLSFRCDMQRLVEDFAFQGHHTTSNYHYNNPYQQQRPQNAASPSLCSSASSIHSYQSYDNNTLY